MSCPASLDASFGPSIASCRRSFDFSLAFEETILTILPAGIFILLAIPRFYVLSRKPPTGAAKGWMWWCKMAVIIIQATLTLSFLALTSLDPPTHLSIPSATLRLLPPLLFAPLSHLTHARTSAPDPLLTTYLAITPLFTAAQIRTLFLSFSSLEASLLSTTLGSGVVLLVLESFPPPAAGMVGAEITKPPPEERAGPVALSLMTWLLPLLTRGYRTTLSLSSLPSLPAALSIESISPGMKLTWTPARPLLLTAALALWKPLLAPVLPRLALVGFTFAQPFLVGRVLSFLASRGDDSEKQETGWALVGAYALVYVGIGASTAWYNWMVYRMMVSVRGGLVGLVWDKLLIVPMAAGGPSRQEKGKAAPAPAAEKPATTTEKDEPETDEKALSDTSSSSATSVKPSPPPPDASSALTLMSTDTERILSGLKYTHEPAANILEAILAIYLLTRQVGLASLSMVALALLCVFLSTLVASRSARLQGLWMTALQTRVTTTASTLGSLKAIKLLSLEPSVTSLLQGLRDKEVTAAGGFRSSIVVSVGLSYATLIFSPVVVFGAFTGVAKSRGQTLDTERLFTSLTVIGLLASPLVHLFQALPALSAAWGCAGRIQAFLCSAELPRRSDDRDGVTEDIAVKVSGGAFGWGEQKIVNEVDTQVRTGTLTLLLGPVGSGKSILLRGLLGEVPLLSGSMAVTGRLAYCDQAPWLVNGSVKDNVVGPGEWDESWYEAVMKACAIDAEISGLENIGSGGVGLSGGQKQRVSLARAVYARREVILLDDVFSGLDKKTVETIFSRLWGVDGLLRKLGTTVIFATHGVGYLRYADAVIALGSDGRIVEQGQISEVLEQGGYVSGLISNSEVAEEVGEEGEEDEKAVVKREEDKKEKDEEEGRRDREVYMYYFRAIGKVHSGCFLVGGVAFGVLLKFPDQWLTWWSNSNATHPNERIPYYLGIYAMFNVLAFISLCLWAWHLFHGVVASSGRNLHRGLLKTVMNAPFPYISRIDTGTTTNRFSQDMLLVDGNLPLSLLNTAAELFTFLTQFGLICAATPLLLITLPPLALITGTIQHTYLRTSKQLRLLDIASKSPLYTLFLSTSSGLPTIRAHNAGAHLTSQTNKALNESQKPVYLLYCVQVWLNLVLDLVVAGLAVVIVCVAVALGGKSGGLGGMLSTSAVGLALTNITTLGETLKNLVVSYTTLETSLGAISRLESFSRLTPQESDISGDVELPENWPSSGKIEFRAVSFAYSENAPPVLDNVSITIPPTQHVALTGRSGSGKTTLLSTFTRLLPPTSGSILLDGIDISTIPRIALARAITVIPQDSYFLPGTLRSNLDPENTLGDEELHSILSLLELTSVVGALDTDLDAPRLSAGQRQLLSLGRAVVRARGRKGRAGVLVLDEAMSSVDSVTAGLMERIIADEFSAWTVVSVVHRGRLDKYNRVVVLEGGRVVGGGDDEMEVVE